MQTEQQLQLPTPRPEKGSHCASCGTPYAPRTPWPRRCTTCGDTAYRNPLPVAVALLPVRDAERTGLVVITRAIEPARGTLALPGGFIDHREDWRHAVVRELAEETGIEAHADEVRLADALSSPDGHLLLFGLLPPRPADALPEPTPTDETYGWEILTAPRELGFPLHTLAARRWFDGAY
ncbi:NUDIX domain-containing protein [Streptomyces cavernicola]|uniref:NUDIX domain-containing protein n=1 Tax=Streptomyces cavernicola TaxID=3043613 RepID=A0ABT6SEB2_9ACTN|nr:NUDIX domain-containing protein [Streptomyces sp. B-S-A6]MDI3406521.1 NUDIX domain-containing protein [Streptomyces sp. B-S-A6]